MNAHRARKRFGQHFLADPGVVGEIVHAIGPCRDDTVVEIGPGRGALTTPLAARAGSLHVIELDRDLAALLRNRYASSDRVVVHEADALRFDLSSIGESLRVVGNLPYNISTPILFHLLDQRERIRDMHFMLQKEVVDRMAAEPGSKAYGRLTVMLGCRMHVEALFDVGRRCFEPPPAVTSSVVRLTPRAADEFDISDEAVFSDLVSRAFGQRRKTIRNALRRGVDEVLLEAAAIDPGARAEAVPIASFVKLANLVAAREHR